MRVVRRREARRKIWHAVLRQRRAKRGCVGWYEGKGGGVRARRSAARKVRETRARAVLPRTKTHGRGGLGNHMVVHMVGVVVHGRRCVAGVWGNAEGM